jgi:hypothetical protein
LEDRPPHGLVCEIPEELEGMTGIEPA